MRSEYERPTKRVSVTIEMMDGETLEAEMTIGLGETPASYLNGSVQFIEVEDNLRCKILIAKSSISRITPHDEASKAKPGKAGYRNADKKALGALDPYLVLDVSHDAGEEEVRSAYYKLVRAYHPDRLAGLELPPEILEHGEEILKRVNAAYTAITRMRRGTGSSAA